MTCDFELKHCKVYVTTVAMNTKYNATFINDVTYLRNWPTSFSIREQKGSVKTEGRPW